MDGRLTDEVVLVTGAARGIGKAIATKAAEEGAAVALLDIRADLLLTTAGEIKKTGATVASAVGDITDEDSVRRAVAELTNSLGRPSTVLVNNAGINAYADATQMTVAEWDSVFDVDLKGSWLMARAVLPAMIEAGHGAIVNIASIHSSLTTAGMFPYAAAKSGLVGLTRPRRRPAQHPRQRRQPRLHRHRPARRVLRHHPRSPRRRPLRPPPRSHRHPRERSRSRLLPSLPSSRLRNRRQLVRRRRPNHPLRLTPTPTTHPTTAPTLPSHRRPAGRPEEDLAPGLG